jgi:hypothetical protein
MKSPKGVSKKAVKKLNENRTKPVNKRYGKTVMKEDPSKPGRKIGYATTAKTKLPKMGKRKVGKGASKQAKKSWRGAKWE